MIGSLAGVGALQQIDSGCGPTGKLVYDAAAIADPEIDYSDYDTDKDGVVDFFMVVFAGCGGNGASQLSVAGCDIDGPAGPAPYDNVWPHSSSLEYYYSDEATGLPGFTTDDQLKDLEGQPLWYTDDSRTDMTTTDTGDALKVFVRVGPYNVNPETAIDKASVISHEYGHSLGLPDFYSTGSRETYGDWNLMATDKSQNMDAFGRQELGWVVPEVLEPGTTTSVTGFKDSKQDTGTISWQQPGRHAVHPRPTARTGPCTTPRCTSPSCPVVSSSTRRSSTPATRRPRPTPGGRAPATTSAAPRRPAATSTSRIPGLADLPDGQHGEPELQVAVGHRVGLRLRLRPHHDRRRRDLPVARVGERLHDVEHRPAGRQPQPERLPGQVRQRPDRHQRLLRGRHARRPTASSARHRRPVFLADSYDISDLAGRRGRGAAVQLRDRPRPGPSRLVHRRRQGHRHHARR